MKDPKKEFSFSKDDFPTLAQPSSASENSAPSAENRAPSKPDPPEEAKPPDLSPPSSTLANGAFDKHSKLSTTSKSFAPKQKPNEDADRQRFGVQSYMQRIKVRNKPF